LPAQAVPTKWCSSESGCDKEKNINNIKNFEMAYFLLVILFVRLAIAFWPAIQKGWSSLIRFLRPLHFGKTQKPLPFETNYLEVKQFYWREFGVVPCISYMNDLDGSAVFKYLDSGSAGSVRAIYQRNYFNWERKEQEFSTTIFKFDHELMIELGDEYVEVLYHPDSYAVANSLLHQLTQFKAPAKEKEYEINIISLDKDGLDLKTLAIKPTVLDINLYYNDDFKPINALIKKRLAQTNDKGIILLHGLPGTGKTTYLRHLIGSTEKRVLFVSPSVAGNLMNPEFIDLLIGNPNSVLVIEDAENIIIDRKHSNNSSVSNLLNISDGLLSDCLNVQIICTFNSHLSTVDSALLRKGRLIAKYEFGKLETAKAQALSNHLGFDRLITAPMTIAEIANPDDMAVEQPRTEVLGFRRAALMN
jgi:hypothetical protein